MKINFILDVDNYLNVIVPGNLLPPLPFYTEKCPEGECYVWNEVQLESMLLCEKWWDCRL